MQGNNNWNANFKIVITRSWLSLLTKNPSLSFIGAPPCIDVLVFFCNFFFVPINTLGYRSCDVYASTAFKIDDRAPQFGSKLHLIEVKFYLRP